MLAQGTIKGLECVGMGQKYEGRVVRVLVVDDYEPFRRFLCKALKTRLELQVIGAAADGLEAVQKAKDLKPDLILLDIGLPKLNGIETAERLSRHVPKAKILFISQNNDAEVIAAALSNGAKGYIWKETAAAELVPAIETVLRGDRFIGSQLRTESSELRPSNPDQEQIG